MGSNQLLFWLVTCTIAVVAGWWMAARPRDRMRGVAVPVTALVLVLSVLAVLLSVTGHDIHELVMNMRALAS